MTSRANNFFCRGFTMAEVLAALLLMAIVVPVALQGVQIASRAGTLGQRKAAAMRVAERVLNELIATDGLAQSSGSGTANEGDQSYAWTMQTETWPEDAMNVVTVRVVFNVQGNDYNVSLSSIYDPTTVALTGSQSP
jgi:prepilin-type N-terminal cleavage/methylation domain-containing protein